MTPIVFDNRVLPRIQMAHQPQRFCKICFGILYHTNIRKCNGENSKILNIMSTKKMNKSIHSNLRNSSPNKRIMLQ